MEREVETARAVAKMIVFMLLKFCGLTICYEAKVRRPGTKKNRIAANFKIRKVKCSINQVKFYAILGQDNKKPSVGRVI
jgi:hypothetical protein